MDVLVQQSTAALGDEEGWATARSKMSIAPLGVATELVRDRIAFHLPNTYPPS